VIGPEKAVDAIGALFGRHRGFRALHAKGNFYRASFTATPDAAGLTRAAHFQGQAVDATSSRQTSVSPTTFSRSLWSD
jgi:catalase